MSGQSIPIGMDLSAEAEKRNIIFCQSLQRLQYLAWRAVTFRHARGDDEIAICIHADDPRWRYLADRLVPNANWQQYRDQGRLPVAHGMINFWICEHLAEVMPQIADALREVPPEGTFKAIVLAEGGCTIYEIEPEEDSS